MPRYYYTSATSNNSSSNSCSVVYLVVSLLAVCHSVALDLPSFEFDSHERYDYCYIIISSSSSNVIDIIGTIIWL